MSDYKDQIAPQDRSPSTKLTDESLSNENIPKHASTATALRNHRIFERMRAGLPSARTLFKKPEPTPVPPANPADLHEEIHPQKGDITIEAVKWARRRDIPISLLAWAGVALLSLWLASHVIQTILLLVIAALLAYALAPLVTILGRVMPRMFAVLIVYVVVLTGISGLLFLVVSSAVAQITSLTHLLVTFITPGQQGQKTPIEQILQPLGITSDQIIAARNQLIAQLGGVAGSIVPFITGVAGALLDILLVIILSIYLLFDGSRVVSWFRRDMPHSQQNRVRFLLNTMQRIVGGYIRGQLIMSTLIGVLVGLGMAILGVPYALLLGVLAFVLEFIPILGTLISGAICILLALTKGWIIALIVLGYFILVHIFEGDIVGPRIVGKAVGLHPVVSIIALIAGSELFGIEGALFASPVAGVLQALIVAIWVEWRSSHPDEFELAKQKVAQKVTDNAADKPLEINSTN
jgi:predicted PurR-regulated permease PerM